MPPSRTASTSSRQRGCSPGARSQRWARWVLDTHYRDAPDGLAGNDDGGTLTAWYVFASIGLFPIAGSDRYVVGAPIFTRAQIAVPGGTFTIEAPEASAKNMYVQSVELNGAPLARPEIRHVDLRPGGTLRFTMGPAPSTWGRD